MAHLPLCSIMTVAVLAGCGTQAPAPQPNPIRPPGTHSASPTPSASPSGPAGASMVAGREAAESLGYLCEQVDPAVAFIVGQVVCTREASELVVAEYASAQDRGRHLRSWGPRPARPVGELWLVAADHPEDLPVVAGAIAGS